MNHYLVIEGLLLWLLADVAPQAHGLAGAHASQAHQTWTVLGTVLIAGGVLGNALVEVGAIVLLRITQRWRRHKEER